ncbi:carbonic anhydrase [Candidatus Omnitrophota bacterium]
MAKEFATAINCIDGRAQKPVTEYMQKRFGVDYVDMITEPGPNKILSEGKNVNIIEFIREKVKVSVKKHNSQIIAVVAHYDCAGNPAHYGCAGNPAHYGCAGLHENEDLQKEHLRKAVNVIVSWGFPVKKIVALWLDENFKPSIIG